jgi:hypothetical protein
VTLAEAYFDESGTHAGARVMAVSGYIFDSEKIPDFNADWDAACRHYGVPYFHSTDVIPNARKGPFAHLDDAQADQFVRRLISIIHKYMIFGFSVSVDRVAFQLIMPNHEAIGDEYRFIGLQIFGGLYEILERYGRSFERIGFNFESGHGSQSALNRMANEIAADSEAAELIRYSHHTFVQKRSAPPVQAADFLAWHAVKSHQRFINDLPIRKDFQALAAGGLHKARHLGQMELLEILGHMMEIGVFGEWQAFSDLRRDHHQQLV